jgi:hypothetical protein
MKKRNQPDRRLNYLILFQFTLGCLASPIICGLAGCDPLHGVTYTVAVARVPSPTVASSALRSVKGLEITYIGQGRREWGIGLRGKWEDPGPYIFSFHRHDQNKVVSGALALCHDSADGPMIVLDNVHMGGPRFSDDEMRWIRSLLDDVYAALRQKDPSLPDPSQTKIGQH